MIQCPICREKMKCRATRSWDGDVARRYVCQEPECTGQLFTIERVLDRQSKEVFTFMENRRRNLQRLQKKNTIAPQEDDNTDDPVVS
jgi:hypothetical protein